MRTHKISHKSQWCTTLPLKIIYKQQKFISSVYCRKVYIYLKTQNIFQKEHVHKKTEHILRLYLGDNRSVYFVEAINTEYIVNAAWV